MAEPRTDLAAEAHGINAERGVDDGIVISESKIGGVKITRAEVFAGEGEQKSGRRAGLYLTAEPGRVWLQSGEERRAAAEAVRRLLLSLLPEGGGAVLVAGLGNEAVTPDSVGPRTVGGLVVTHHMRALSAELYEALSFGDAAAVCPGVLGQTGIESAELIKAAVGSVRPRCVVAVDALAARSLDRLGTTIQLTNAGIAPGSGVCNGRAELSERTLGCPVIGVGVPTVVDAQTLVCELAGSGAGQNGRGGEAGQDGRYKNFFVTPKETDVMIRVMSKLLATAINLALHPNAPDINEYAPL